MRKEDLIAAVDAAKKQTQAALQTVYDALNQGQQKKLVKDEEVRKLLDRHGVKHE